MLEQREKEIIDLRKSHIKDESSFYSKIFFTVVSIVIGFVYLYIKGPDFKLTEGWLALIIFGILLFYIQSWGLISDLRRLYNKLISNVIESDKLEDYNIEKRGWYYRITFGISVGYFVFVIILLLFKSLWWAFGLGIIFAIAFSFAPRHF